MTVTPAIEHCIDVCLRCYRVCTQMVSLHCLQIGGEHNQPGHIRAMLECAELCRTNAHFMLIDGAFALELASACAEVCRATADSCRMLDGLQACIEACEACADCCEKTAAAAA